MNVFDAAEQQLATPKATVGAEKQSPAKTVAAAPQQQLVDLQEEPSADRRQQP